MNRMMLVMMFAVTAAGIAGAQQPARPTPVPRPALPLPPDVPEPAITPLPAIAPMAMFDAPMFDFPMHDFDIEMQAARHAAEAVRAQAIDFGDIASEVRAAIAPVAAMAPMALSFGGVERAVPPQAWAPGDPADSLYRVAREALNRGDYGRAARMFAELQKSYPRSAYAGDSQYWEAWARYKIGTTDELHAASKLLEPLASRVTPADARQQSAMSYVDRSSSSGRRTSDNDMLALYARINGVLAQRGDRDAAAKVEKAASTLGTPCDREDSQVRAEALNALSQMDPTAALPILRRVIDRRDQCSASLRRSAVFMLGRRADSDAAALLMNVAKNDPDLGVRAEAVSFLARAPGDAGIAALEGILRTEKDERIQRAAVHALVSSDNPRARTAVRALTDRADTPIALRVEAINSLASDRATTDDAAYVRGLYAKADSDRLKNAIVNAVARIGGSENDQWVMSIVRNKNESSAVRANALARFTRSASVSTADLAKLYDDSAESLEIRRRIVSILGSRSDSASTDKLIEIVKNGTVVSLRTQAINALASKKDPRATQLLTDILDGKQP
jgi:HEAT repeat protein